MTKNIATRVAVHSTIEQPAGSMAVVVPNVFPSASPRDNLSNVHDIIRGQLPIPGSDDTREGWLRLAMPTGDNPAYVDPNLSPDQKLKIQSNYRRTETGKVEVDTVTEIVRGMVRIDDLTARVRVAGSSVYLPSPERNLSNAWPIESALAFTGRIALERGERHVFGVHFQSTKEQGWARLVDPAEFDDEPAKVQQEPFGADEYRRSLLLN